MDDAIIPITPVGTTVGTTAGTTAITTTLGTPDLPPLSENEKCKSLTGEDQSNSRNEPSEIPTGSDALQLAVALAVADTTLKSDLSEPELEHHDDGINSEVDSHSSQGADHTHGENITEATGENDIAFNPDLELESGTKAQRSATDTTVDSSPPTKRSRLSQSRDENWENMFNCLLKYREEKGHCLVPKTCSEIEYKSLSHWVYRQRSLYMTRQRKGEKKNTLTPARIERLSAIGFVFKARGAKAQTQFESQRRKPASDANWTKNFEYLRKFKDETGHTLVPKIFKENQTFSSWVYTQRHLYKKRQAGLTNVLTDQRIESLNSLDFVWNAKKDKQWKDRDRQLKNDKVKDLWQKYFNELVKFKEVHGHTMVPKVYKENQALSSWVFRQRKHFRLREQGLEHSMMDYRLQQLQDIKFQFRVRGHRRPNSKDDTDTEGDASSSNIVSEDGKGTSQPNENVLSSEEERKSGDETTTEFIEQSRSSINNSSNSDNDMNLDLDKNENDKHGNLTNTTRLTNGNQPSEVTAL